METEFEQWSQALSNAVAQVAPGVVRVEARRRRPSSGILLSAGGLIVTSAHAVERDENLRVSFDGEATVDAELMGRAKPDAVFLHCLPAYRGLEVSAEVLDGPQSVIWDEAENRLHAQKAVLAWLLEKNATEGSAA